MTEFDVTISVRLEGPSTREVNNRIERMLDSSLPYSDPTVKRADWSTVPKPSPDEGWGSFSKREKRATYIFEAVVLLLLTAWILIPTGLDGELKWPF